MTHILSEWGCVFVVTASHAVYALTEKDTSTKLEHLFKIHLFDIAISLAYSSNYDYANIMDIYRVYGDYLYAKKDYDSAIAQYTSTIGYVEPSYVIRLFLDAQRIANLTTYLEALHAKHVATADHTTLLLNCYTKARAQDKLRAFIRGGGAGGSGAAAVEAAAKQRAQVGAKLRAGGDAGAAGMSTAAFGCWMSCY